MQVSEQVVNQMLRNLPQDQQNVMAAILTGKVAYEVICNSQDVYEDVEVPVVDENNEPVFYKSGKNKGQQKTTTEKQLVREGANGRVIAHIMQDESVVPLVDENQFMWLRSSRRRLDGEWGFQSWCGTDSLLAEQEKGIISEAQPTKDDLYRIAAKLEQNKSKYVTINGEREVDGFIIREVKN